MGPWLHAVTHEYDFNVNIGYIYPVYLANGSKASKIKCVE